MSEGAPPANPPGQPEIRFRLGTHAEFLAEMRAAVARTKAISSLASAAPTHDLSIALLDCWAMVGDVITFYQERLANEFYIRTATRRRSVVELARQTGYELNTGVAAAAQLAFTVEPPPSLPGYVEIDVGTAVQSIPGRNELPQTFETVERLLARPEWNVMSLLGVAPSTARVWVDFDNRCFDLAGVSAMPQIGDAVLLADQLDEASRNRAWCIVLVTAVAPAVDRTRVIWGKVYGDIAAVAAAQRLMQTEDPQRRLAAAVLRQRMPLFGYDAADWRLIPDAVRQRYCQSAPDPAACVAGSDWPGFTVKPNGWLDLARVVPNLTRGGWFLLLDESRLNDTRKNPEIDRFLTAHRAAFTDIDPDAPDPASAGAYIEEGRTILADHPSAPQPQRAALAAAIAAAQLIIDGMVEIWLSPIADVTAAAALNFGMSGQVTRLTPAAGHDTSKFTLRGSIVHCQSEPLAWATDVVLDFVPFGTRNVELQLPALGLEIGRKLIFEGKRIRVEVLNDGLVLRAPDGGTRDLERGEQLVVMNHPPLDAEHPMSSPPLEWTLMTADGFVGSLQAVVDRFAIRPAGEEDAIVACVQTVEEPPTVDRPRHLSLRGAIDYWLDPATVTAHGNVADATEGASVSDVLGSGNPASVGQSFELNRPPLTYVSAGTPSGRRSTLEVRVDGVLWRETPTLFGEGPRAQAYMVRSDGLNRTRVVFGDGHRGARLPAGQENVVASYRSGMAPVDQEVGAHTLTLVLKAPLGVSAVTNPLPARGASSPQTLTRAGLLTASGVRFLDRIIDVSDYEDFASNFAGITKAKAIVHPDRMGRVVWLTVAAADGKPVTPDLDLYSNLYRAIVAFSDSSQAFVIFSYHRVDFGVVTEIWSDPAMDTDKVLASVREALIDTFSFAAAALGETVTEQKVLAVTMGCRGVLLATVWVTALTEASVTGPESLWVIDPGRITLEARGALP